MKKVGTQMGYSWETTVLYLLPLIIILSRAVVLYTVYVFPLTSHNENLLTPQNRVDHILSYTPSIVDCSA